MYLLVIRRWRSLSTVCYTHCQVQAYLTCCKLRSAYLIAVKQEHSRATVLVQQVQQAARSSGDAVVQDICAQWLLTSHTRGAHGSGSRKWSWTSGPENCGTKMMEMLSTFFLCSKTFLALPKLKRAGLDPACHLEQGQDLSRKCHVSVKLWNLCVSIGRWPVLSTSEWVSVCAQSYALMFTPKHFWTNETLLLKRGTLF